MTSSNFHWIPDLVRLSGLVRNDGFYGFNDFYDFYGFYDLPFTVYDFDELTNLVKYG